MNLKDKKLRKNKISVLVVTVGLLVVASVTGGVLFYGKNKALADTKASNTDKPTFMFDETKAPGWWSGGNNWPDIKDYTGGQVTETDLPVASISVGQGESGSMGDCFVDYYLQKQTLSDVAAAVSEMEKRSVDGGDNITLSPLGVQAIKIETLDGVKTYQLHQYEVTGAGNTKRAKGVQFGYMPLKSGRIEVRSYCNEADQLDETLPAIKAVRLVSSI